MSAAGAKTSAAPAGGLRQLPIQFEVPKGINKRCDLPPEAYIKNLASSAVNKLCI